MSEMQQGEEYIEEDLDDFASEESDEFIGEDDESIDFIMGIPKKYVYIGAVALVVLVLLIVVFATRKKKADDVVIPPDFNTGFEQAENIDFYDTPAQETNAPAGDTYVEPAPVPEAEPEPLFEVGEVSNGLMWDGTSWVPVEPEIDFETNKRLRAAGYTGDEIDYALRNGFDLEALIEESNKLYDEEAKKALERMSDTASEEFKFLLENSYFGEVGYQFVPQKDLPLTEMTVMSDSFVVNADYVKCPTYGSQLYLKCKVAADLNVFMVMTPQRWDTLPDAGNIVLRVYYTQYGPNRYVTDIREVDSSLETIDTAAKNTESLDEIIEEDVPSEEVTNE